MNKVPKLIIPPAVFFIVFMIYASCCEEFTVNLLRWGEIVAVLSLLAGLYKFVSNKVLEIRDISSSSFYSLVTVSAFFFTFAAGMLNFSSERFAFSNIIREQPGFLLETTKIVIDDDAYLRKFPAKNKLALLIASKISRHFVPTDEMLRNSGMSFEEYQNFIYPGASQISDVRILKDDREYADIVNEKVTGISRNTVNIMIPVTETVREWAYEELSLKSGRDLVLDGRTVEGSLDILNKEMQKAYSFNGNRESSAVDIYRMISKDKTFVGMISSAYSQRITGRISDDAKRKVIASFLQTGISASPRMKGTLRWIYRYIYDPLFSTFMAIIVFFMVISAYRHFDLRKYSTAVITFSAVSVLLGFIPQTQSLVGSLLPASWQGPMSSGWIMNFFALPVFKAFAIGTGTGVVFMYVNRYLRFHSGGDGNEK